MRHRDGFTRAEVAVVLGIGGIVTALLLPAVHKLREASHRTNCINNLRSIGGACHSYHDIRRKLPPGGNHTPPANSACLEPACRDSEWSWSYHLLPYLGHPDVYGNPSAAAVQGTAIPGYYCPSRRRPRCHNRRGMLDYAANAGTAESSANGAIKRTSEGQLALSEFSDGACSTVLVGEKRMNAARFGTCPGDREGFATAGWTDRFEEHRLGSLPPAADTDASGDDSVLTEFGSAHPGVVNAVFADGAVRTIRFSVRPATWRRACGRNDNQSFNLNNL